MYTHMYVICTYIYIYMYLSLSLYIYIYIHICLTQTFFRSGEQFFQIMAILETTKNTSSKRGRIRQVALDK